MDAAYIGRHVAFGNKKLPDTTAIWNVGAAWDCPARPLGLCQSGRKCYALLVERFRPRVRAYRRRQREIMDQASGPEIGRAILARCKAREKRVKLFRFGQSGDFRDQRDVAKMVRICVVLAQAGIRCYGFTARTDLNLKTLLSVAHLGVSNDTGNWIRKGANRYKVVAQPSGKNWVCPKDCTICSRCSTERGVVIETTRLWKAQMTFNDIAEYCEEWE